MAVIVCGTMTIASCGSSHSSSSAAGESTSVASLVPSAASSIPPAPTSVVPAPSSIPGNVQAPCAALKAALPVSDLQPKNSGNWTAERQRIQTDAASDAALFSAASKGVPNAVVTALETLKAYSTWIGTTVADSATYEAATKAIKAYPDSAAATLAMATVDTWSRTNC